MSARSETKERTREKLAEPKQYQVIMHNDDFTTMQFVVSILIDIFHKEPTEAETLMMTVHKKGRARVGRYPYDIAVTRVTEALSRAREEGFPFRMTVDED
ncbi:MAG: ATP-dependent Clp protease adaptor ClpS [Lachnospiraceae bacterium]|nr:ATP-dependent Clp protease adaptor ClpS [Lachnospiraceae bacterium]